MAICHHVLENFVQLIGLNLPFLNEKHAGVRVALDGRKRLIQLMGERSGHFA